MNKLKGKVAVITGGATGIGLATARLSKKQRIELRLDEGRVLNS